MTAVDKPGWRADVLDARRRLSDAARRRSSLALSHAASDLAREAGADPSADSAEARRGVTPPTIAAYVPVGAEPGHPGLLDALLASGARIILPVAREPGPMRWAVYTGPDALVPARFGLREPAEPHLPPDALAAAEVVLVPALAVDRRGTRLGRGAGFYDRTLHAARPDARLVAVVHDHEFVDHLPGEPHDVRMTHVLTPSGGLVALAEE